MRLLSIVIIIRLQNYKINLKLLKIIYFPMQNLENIEFKTSPVVTSPVILPI